MVSLGLFSNTVMDLWAFAAIAFLILGIYLPLLNAPLNLTIIPAPQLLMIAFAMLVIVGGLLEVRKAFKPAQG